MGYIKKLVFTAAQRAPASFVTFISTSMIIIVVVIIVLVIITTIVITVIVINRRIIVVACKLTVLSSWK